VENRHSLDRWPLVYLAVFAWGIVGCGGGPQTFQVTGKVTFQDKPVDQGLINFRSSNGTLYGGGLQQGGLYECVLPLGDFEVRIDAPVPLPNGWKEGDPLPVNPRRLVPLKYANFRSAGLKATVSAEPSSHEIHFELK